MATIITSKSGPYGSGGERTLTHIKWGGGDGKRPAGVELSLREAAVVSLPADPTTQHTVIKVREEDARTIKRLHTQIQADCGAPVRKPLQVDEAHGVVLSCITIVKPLHAEQQLTLDKGEVYEQLQLQVVGVLRGEQDRKSSLLLAVRGATLREVPVEEPVVVDDGRREEAEALRVGLQQAVDDMAYKISELHERIREREIRAAELQGVIDALDAESPTWFQQAKEALADAPAAEDA